MFDLMQNEQILFISNSIDKYMLNILEDHLLFWL